MDNIRILGEFSMKTFKIIDNKKHLIESYVDKNLVVDEGRFAMCKLLSTASSVYHISRIGFGDGMNLPDVGDGSLTNLYLKNIIDFNYSGLKEVIFNWELLANESNGLMIREYGLFTFGGTLFSRKIRTEIEKKINIVLEGSWKIIFI